MSVNKIKQVALRLNIITVDDLCCYTIPELVMLIATRLNEVIEEINSIDKDLYEECLDILTEWTGNGVFDEIINQSVLKDINERVNEIANRATGELALQRIGRKLIIGEHPNMTTYNPVGKAGMLQGACRIDDDIIAYMLWDNLNPDLNKNELIVMNLHNGSIITRKEFNYGWCNSLAYIDGKIYVAERGQTHGSGINNGIIRIIDYPSLNEVEFLNLPINVNAIAYYDNILYVLEEGTTTLHRYQPDGQPLNKTVELKTSMTGLYNQAINIDDKGIYLISSKPSNILHVFSHQGKLIRCLNIPKHGGIYYVGEPEFIYTQSTGDMIFGSAHVCYNEPINQFFKCNLETSVATNVPTFNYAETYHVNSTVNYYNPTGEIGNEFTSFNEAANLSVRNYFLNGNNKTYKYSHFTDNEKYIQIQNAIFSEGAFVQYANVSFLKCTFQKLIRNDSTASIQIRDSKVIFRECTFDGGNGENCVDSIRHNQLKFAQSSFINYTEDAILNVAGGNVINFNDNINLPFVRHSNIKKYNLYVDGYMNEYKKGTYPFNTPLSPNEIQKIMDNCLRIKIIYKPFNNATKIVELEKNRAQSYAFTDTTISTTGVNFRCCKIQFSITNTGLTIESNVSTQFKDGEWSIIDDSTNFPTDVITICAVEYLYM